MGFTLPEAIDGGFRIFSRFSAAKQKEMISACHYISQISSSSSINSDKWDVAEVFGAVDSFDTNEIVTDPREINARFFSHFKKIQENITPEILAIESQILSAMHADSERVYKKLLSDSKMKIQDYNVRLEEAIKNADDYRTLLLDMERLLASVELKKGDAVSDLVQKVLRDNFFELEDFVSPCIIFKTKNDIIVKRKNPSHGQDFEVNFGKFRVFYNMSTGKVSVGPHTNNFNVQEYQMHLHCFVRHTGEVCWGNMDKEASHLASKMQIDAVMRLLSVLLTTVDQGGFPYQSLEVFREFVLAHGQPQNKYANVREPISELPEKLLEHLKAHYGSNITNQIKTTVLCGPRRFKLLDREGVEVTVWTSAV